MANTTDKKILAPKDMASKQAAKVLKLQKKGSARVQESFGDKVLLTITTIILLLVLIIVAYPCIYVVSSSLSSNTALQAGRVMFLPVEASLASYKFVFKYDVVWQGYRNTIFFTVCGVPITMFLQTLAAYPLSRRHYQGRKLLTTVFFLTTMVSAGMIPTLIVRSAYGLRNSVWAILLAGAVGFRNTVILRTCFQSSIPYELYDAASIDGANDFQTLWKIALPLSKATLSVLTLYSAVGCWNEYFTSLLYLPNRRDLWPLQLVLRPIMMAANSSSIDAGGMSASAAKAFANTGTEGVVFALIVIATVPLLIMYTVVQKYFEKGVMVGSVKG